MSKDQVGRSLDCAIARALGCELQDSRGGHVTCVKHPKPTDDIALCESIADGFIPQWSADLNEIYRLEVELERRGLEFYYIDNIARLQKIKKRHPNSWDARHASASQCARAALLVLSKQGGSK